jgi:hypothetical protein
MQQVATITANSLCLCVANNRASKVAARDVAVAAEAMGNQPTS